MMRFYKNKLYHMFKVKYAIAIIILLLHATEVQGRSVGRSSGRSPISARSVSVSKPTTIPKSSIKSNNLMLPYFYGTTLGSQGGSQDCEDQMRKNKNINCEK